MFIYFAGAKAAAQLSVSLHNEAGFMTGSQTSFNMKSYMLTLPIMHCNFWESPGLDHMKKLCGANKQRTSWSEIGSSH